MKKKGKTKPIDTDAAFPADAVIAYQNKDIVSKLFGDQMKGKPLSLFGLDTDLKVVDIRPTNIPVVRAKELRMDNLFELEDGSIAILDYESDCREMNFIKYGYYILNVIDRYLNEGKEPDIHMMVLYTADIEQPKTMLERTACHIQIEAATLIDAPSNNWLEEARQWINHPEIPDEILMHLILLPLTYRKEEEKQESIRVCVDLAAQIPDNQQKTFVLAGILTFTDKIISEETKRYIEEVLEMTQVGMMLMDKGRKEGEKIGEERGQKRGQKIGDYDRAKKTALKMLKRGDSLNDIAEILELPTETIENWKKNI